jgi:hypothetical protein
MSGLGGVSCARLYVFPAVLDNGCGGFIWICVSSRCLSGAGGFVGREAGGERTESWKDATSSASVGDLRRGLLTFRGAVGLISCSGTTLIDKSGLEEGLPAGWVVA